jgi:hypothetical protein
MAYLLRSGNDASGEYAALGQTISIANSSSFEIEFNIKANTSGNIRVYGRIGNFVSRLTVNSGLNPNVVFVGDVSQTVTFTTTNLDPLEENTYRLVKNVSNQIELFVNGVSQGAAQSFGESLNITHLLTQSTSSFSRCATDLKYISFTVNGTLVHYYDPSATNGTGLVLTDTVGSNSATLVGYAGDDSQWAFYESEGGGEPEPEEPSISLSGVYAPGQTITVTPSNFAGTPLSANLEDTGNNAINPALTPSGDNYTFPLPALPAAGASVQGLLFGDITVTIDDPGA